MILADSVYKVIKLMEKIAVAALLFTMIITASDVVMGVFKRPITGAYDLAGIGSGIAISFAVAVASWNRQHIMVDTFTQKLPQRLRVFWEFILRVINLTAFCIISLYIFKLAVGLKETGELCNTLSMLPLWPVALLLGCGCLAQLLVSIADIAKIVEGGRHD